MALFGIGDREANDQVLDKLITTGEVTVRQQRKFELEPMVVFTHKLIEMQHICTITQCLDYLKRMKLG